MNLAITVAAGIVAGFAILLLIDVAFLLVWDLAMRFRARS